MFLVVNSNDVSETQVVRLKPAEVGGNLWLLVQLKGRLETGFEWPWQRRDLSGF